MKTTLVLDVDLLNKFFNLGTKTFSSQIVVHVIKDFAQHDGNCRASVIGDCHR